MLEPEKVDASPQPPAADLKPHLYKCLLNQYAQKLRKQSPIYQTHNEGFEHQPKFRSTVWIDGVSYTSSNTFQQRKMAEMDVSKIAFCAIMQKLKDVASQLVHEDKTFCKSILVEYAARMSIGKPIYQTIQLDALVPVFRSSLVLNDVTHTGDSGKSKKEAEQLAARAAILKCLDSESGNLMSEIVNCKFRHYAEMSRIKEIYNVHNGTNAVGVKTGFDNGVALKEVKSEAGTGKMPNTSVLPDPSLVQSTIIPATVVSVGMTQPPIPEASTLAISSVIPLPTVLVPTTFSGTNNSPISSAISAPSSWQFANITATHANVTQATNLEATSVPIASPLPLVSPVLQQMPFANLTSSKKRNRKNKKNAQKKIRVEAQLPTPVVSMSQVPTCSAQ